MKKIVFSLFLAAALSLAGASGYAADAGVGSPVDQFTGKYWVHSLESNRESYLFGIESAIEVEYFINARLAERAAKEGKKPGYMLSPFAKGWMDAFRGVTRKQIANDVTKWYAEHPDQIDKPVLSVIWNELVKPRLGETK